MAEKEKMMEKENKDNLVLLAVGCRLLDKKFNSSPFLFLTGIIFSIFISSFLVYKKTKEVIDDMGK
ncbi:AtpZ/AtpI family protein [Candidatus Wolfebacteria bacterium]|nr:AtpZ/AtpI family protein [Candidatus Wolfebacteria bacterium]